MGFALLSPSYAADNLRLTGEYLKGTETTAAVDPQLVDELHQRGTATMLVYLREKPDLSPAFGMSWEERGHFVYQALTDVAERSQVRLRGELQRRGVNYRSFWVDNVIVVEQADVLLLDEMRISSDVRAIRAEPENRFFAQDDPGELTSAGLWEAVRGAVEGNIAHVGAPEVWAMGHEGSGITVANIDTGVRYTHEALINQYRGNLGGGSFDHNHHWWDPDVATSVPTDTHGHGTMTIGFSVGGGGSRGVGMAPGADWIACRASSGGSIPVVNLFECAEFMVAPWDLNQENPDPDSRPHVVNNSWGACDQAYNPWFQDAVDAWIAAGIIPVISNGNAGNCGYSEPPGLNTVGNPARYGNVLGIGSTAPGGEYAVHSNWGPTDNPNPGLPDYPDHMGHPHLKPNVMAPGQGVCSAHPASDSTYGCSLGTSFASPHVAGLIALMWDAAACLIGDYATTGTIIQQTARPIPYQSGGVPPPGHDNHPNYATGWGEIDAVNAVAEAKIRCGDHGRLVGTVTSAATGTPIPEVDVVIDNPLGPPAQFTVRTDADGEYQRIVAALAEPDGTYSVNFSKSGGFGTAEVTLVEVGDGQDAELNVALDAGFLALPDEVHVTVPYGEVTEFEVDLTNAGTLDTPVTLELFRGVREDFESVFSPDDWQVVNHGGDCVWARNDEVTPPDDPSDPVHGGRPNFAGGQGFSAIADADACGPGSSMDTSLISPPVDLGATSDAALEFMVSYYHLGNSSFSVTSSVDDGQTWDNHIQWNFDVHPFGPGLPRTIDLSPYLGVEDLRLRFHFTGGWDWWAQIDQVRLELALPWGQVSPLATDIPAGQTLPALLEIDTTQLPGPGIYTINLLVEHNTPEQDSPIAIPVTVEVGQPPDTPTLEVMPESIDFGEIEIGAAADAQTVTVTSTGTATVQVSAIGDPVAPFTRSGGDCPAPPFELEPDDSCTVEYGFAPTQEGVFESVVEITANTDPAVTQVTLEGQGVDDTPPPDEVFRDRFEPGDE